MSVTLVTPNQTSSAALLRSTQTSSAMRTMFEVKLYKHGLVHVLADDVEDAAWQALELAAYGDDILIDVCPLNETK